MIIVVVVVVVMAVVVVSKRKLRKSTIIMWSIWITWLWLISLCSKFFSTSTVQPQPRPLTILIATTPQQRPQPQPQRPQQSSVSPPGNFLLFFFFFSFSYALLIYFVLATKIISMAQPLQQRWPQCHTPSLANITNLQPISKPIAATAAGKFSLLCFISYTNVYFKLIYLLMIVWDKRGLETQCISSPQVFFLLILYFQLY